MSSRWGSLLTPGSRIAAVFEGELRQHLAAEYEEDDELVKHVIDQLKEVSTKEKLHTEFVDVFDDGAEDMASWCWDKMQQLSTEPQEEAIDSAPEELLGNDFDEDLELEEEGEEGELPDEGDLAGFTKAALADSAHHTDSLPEQQHTSKKPKREPITFNLEGHAINTAPHKSSRKFQQPPQKQAEKHTADNNAARSAAAEAEAAKEHQLQRAETARSRAESRSKAPARPETPRHAAAAVKGALAASVQAAAAPSRHARISDSLSGRERPAATAGERQPRSPGADESHSNDRERDRALRDKDRNKAREAPTAAGARAAGRMAGNKRSAADAVGRGLIGRAFQQIAGERGARAERGDRAAFRRQPQQQQQQGQEQEPRQEPSQQQQLQSEANQSRQRQRQQGRVSVLDRLGAKEQQEQDADASTHRNVFERLGIPAGDKPPGAAAGEAPSKPQEPAQLQQHKQLPQGTSDAAATANSGRKAQRPSVYARLGAAAAGVDTGEEQQQLQQHQQQQQQQQHQQPGKPSVAGASAKQPAAATAPTRAGIKRTADTATGGAGPSAAVAAATIAPLAKSSSSAAAAEVATAAPAAIKPAAAPAPAASGTAKPGKATNRAAEVAKMRAMLEAKTAEIKRLQQAKQLAEQQEEADKRSVAVFGIPHGVPDSVVRAHFAVCGTMKRLTLLPGRPPHLPGAYIEYDTTRAALQALGLTGTPLLPNCPMLTVQIKHDCHQNRIRGQKSFAALQKSATAATVAGNKNWVKPTLAAPNAASAAGAEPESPASLGDMGLNG